MVFSLWNNPPNKNETKKEWMLGNKDIISACFDDGIVMHTCHHCRKIHCNNYKKAKRERQRRKELQGDTSNIPLWKIKEGIVKVY